MHHYSTGKTLHNVQLQVYYFIEKPLDKHDCKIRQLAQEKLQKESIINFLKVLTKQE